MRPTRCSFAMDATVHDANCLDDAAFLERFVRSTAKAIGMRVVQVSCSAIQEDLIGADPPRFADEGGYSVIALITTSHVAIHTWPEKAYFMMDVVSCRAFDQQLLHDSVKDHLNVKEVQYAGGWPTSHAVCIRRSA